MKLRALPLISEDMDSLMSLEHACFTMPWNREQYATILDAQKTIMLKAAGSYSINSTDCDENPQEYDAKSVVLQLQSSGIKVFGLKDKKNNLLAYLCLCYMPQSQEMEIYNIAVTKAMRCKGLGRCLLARILYLAYLIGVQDVFLEVREGNLPAVSLYSNLGFTLSGTRKNYYSAPVEDALVMHLQLHNILQTLQEHNIFFEEQS